MKNLNAITALEDPDLGYNLYTFGGKSEQEREERGKRGTAQVEGK